MSSYDYNILYKFSKQHWNVSMLSRLPIAEVPIDISVPGETEVRATEYHHNQHAYLQDFKEGEKVSSYMWDSEIFQKAKHCYQELF